MTVRDGSSHDWDLCLRASISGACPPVSKPAPGSLIMRVLPCDIARCCTDSSSSSSFIDKLLTHSLCHLAILKSPLSPAPDTPSGIRGLSKLCWEDHTFLPSCHIQWLFVNFSPLRFLCHVHQASLDDEGLEAQDKEFKCDWAISEQQQMNKYS